MQVSRRRFVHLSTAAAVAAAACGCQSDGGAGDEKAIVPHDVDAGPAVNASAPASDGVDARFRNQGFFLVRRGGQVVALSAICTHRRCPVEPAAGGAGFVCRCHGSEFDADGHVETGPAKRDLPVYATSVDARGHLIVHVGMPPTAAPPSTR